MKMGILWAMLLAALHVLPGVVPRAHAQGTRKDDIVFNSRGVPLAGASVRVCLTPASGKPCTPLAQIFSDPGLTQALANPTTTDGLGNYFFYAAPGKYMVEVSGPGITTKQIPDVIVPLDPTAAVFPGAISAFSLSLAGNLSVTGNTTVIGSLASGTLNLSNQGTPPGAASPGSVNLYTKTADKRLYYKDETGTEIGPLATGTGAQLNVANTFTAPQSIAADFHAKGPNPNFDVSLFGAYQSAFNSYNNGVPTPNTTGSTTSGGTTLTLASAQDFQNGQGIVVTGAGNTNILQTPGAPSVTPVGILNGSTTWNYKVACENGDTSISAASPAGTTTTGAATLGLNSVGVTNVSRTNGVTTYTTSVAHNFQVHQQVNLPNTTGNPDLTGTFDIASTPTSTTFTVDQTGKADVPSQSFSVIASVMAFNQVKLWYATIPTSVNTQLPMRCLIYRSQGAGSFSLVGVAIGSDPFYEDLGVGLDASTGNNTPRFPYYWPAAPPASALPGNFSTTIVSGGGTTTLVLANAAGQTVSGAVVIHDNTPAFKAAATAASNGGTVYVPAGGIYQINFPLVLPVLPSFAQERFLIQAGIHANQPIVPHNSYVFEGEPISSSGPSFFYGKSSQIAGTSMPAFWLESNAINTNIIWENLSLGSVIKQAVGVWVDGQPGSVGLQFYHVAWSAGIGSSAYVDKGGAFDRMFEYGACAAGVSGFGQPACMRFSNTTSAYSASAVVGQVRMREYNFSVTGIQIDNFPSPTLGGTGDEGFTLDRSLYESGFYPILSVYVAGIPFPDFKFHAINVSDLTACCSTPVVQFGNSTFVFNVEWDRGSLTNGSEPLFTGPISPLVTSSPTAFIGTSSFITPTVTAGNIQSLTNGARVGYQLAGPSGTATAVSAGGGVPIATQQYAVSCVDFLGAETPPATSVAAIVTSGNQIVTVSWTNETGCQGYNVYRNGARAHSPTGSFPMVTASPYVDSFAFIDGVSATTFNGTVGTSLSQNLVQAPGFRILNNPFVLTTNVPVAFSANHLLFLPDLTGYNEVSGYVNSAYDSFNRANGAIGANWTVQQNGLNVSSNQIVGTTSSVSNTAFWNASPLAPSQFSQVTITGLNGTADFPGVSVLASGSGATSTYYDCVENSTTIFMQRVVNTATTNMTSAASAGAPGDVLRLEVTQGGGLTCYKNGVVALTQTDTTIVSGSPGILISGNVATMDNWSGGNLHPFAHLDVEQDWTKPQHFTQGLMLGAESLSASPRGEENVFLPGALTSIWTGATWTIDKAITVTRVQVQAKTAAAGCTTNASVRLTDGTSPVNLTISAAANDSGPILQSYAAGSSLTVAVQTAAAGCTTSPADANVVVQYRTQ
jgi:hypothetical protein